MNFAEIMSNPFVYLIIQSVVGLSFLFVITTIFEYKDKKFIINKV